MCGILGATGKMAARVSGKTFHDALELIRHRGPDASGIWRDHDLILGHRRLAVVDLDVRAAQPMVRDEIIVAFNGEIYNFRDLREELTCLGHCFTTSSDTEVLAAAWQHWGAGCLTRLEGMFAFAIWDQKNKKLFLARDRFGEKPMFVYERSDGIAFASELPPLIRLAGDSLRQNKAAVGLFFQFSYIPAPYGPFMGVSQIEPGCWIEWSEQSGIRHQRYYYLEEKIELREAQPQPTYEEACLTLKSMLRKAVRQRVITADVPVASLLSGGLDSSIVTILASQAQDSGKPMSVYSLGFPKDPGFDETDFAKAVTATLSNARHHIVEATEDSVLRFADVLLDKMGEPYADASILPTSLLCSQIDEKVVLGGDGADELFAGYGIYPAITRGIRMPAWVRDLLELVPYHPNPQSIRNGTLRAAALFHRHLRPTAAQSYLSWRSYADLQVLAALGIDTSANTSIAEQMERRCDGSLRSIQILDLSFNLPNDMLKKVDYAAMFQSLEVRLPFLDSTLVEWSLGLPDKFRLNKYMRKRILRDAFAEYLPAKVLRRSKKGFLLPIRNWFRQGKLRDKLISLMSHQTSIDPKIVDGLICDHSKKRCDNSNILWIIYIYLLWLSKIKEWSNFQNKT